MRREGRDFDLRKNLRENLATVIGLRLKLDALKRTEQFKRNERVAGFTPLQRFFLAFAYSNAAHERSTRLTYAPDRDQVNFLVASLPEFYEAFDVKPGNRMYLPESARVSIW